LDQPCTIIIAIFGQQLERHVQTLDFDLDADLVAVAGGLLSGSAFLPINFLEDQIEEFEPRPDSYGQMQLTVFFPFEPNDTAEAQMRRGPNQMKLGSETHSSSIKSGTDS
jgi:hypothetical protein